MEIGVALGYGTKPAYTATGRRNSLHRPAPVDIANLPDIIAMSSAQITAEICPEKPSSCQTLIALYQPTKRRILYRNTLNMKLVKDQSFILHELVHVLQYEVKGEEYRVGGLFRFIRCEDSDTPPAPLGR